MAIKLTDFIKIQKELLKLREVKLELIEEIETLIHHSEKDTIDYSILEHARKVVFNSKLNK